MNMRNIATLAIALLLLTSITDVIGRYFFNKPLPGGTESTVIMLATLVMFAWAYTLQNGKQLTADLITHKFTPRWRLRIGLISSILILAFFIPLILSSVNLVVRHMENNRLVDIILIPLWWFQLVIPIASLAVCLEMIRNIVGLIRKSKGVN